MDEHAEAGLAPPGHAGILVLLAFLRLHIDGRAGLRLRIAGIAGHDVELVHFKFLQPCHLVRGGSRVADQHIVLVNVIGRGILQGRPGEVERGLLHILYRQVLGQEGREAAFARDARAQHDFVHVDHGVGRVGRAEVGLQAEYGYFFVGHAGGCEVEHQVFPLAGGLWRMIGHGEKFLFEAVALERDPQLRGFARAVILHVQVFVAGGVERLFQRAVKACPIFPSGQPGVFPAFGGGVHFVSGGVVHHFELSAARRVHIHFGRERYVVVLKVGNDIVLRPQCPAGKQGGGQDKSLFPFHMS